MLRGRAAEVGTVLALATIVTLVIGAPVLRDPSQRVFGMAIAGRHHDPFTVMAQFARPAGLGIYSQPVTDIPGALLARAAGPVAAYNWLVLLSFPLSAGAVYLLARYLSLSGAGAVVAAMAYAFSPFHLAHAAYHPHVAQTQWIPLYLLALWRCLDRASLAAAALLGAAALIVTLSNFYGGLIAAVITPVAAAAYWLAGRSEHPRPIRRLVITAGTLVLICLAGITYASYAAHAVVVNRAAFAFPRADLFLHSAKWWSYLVPPVEHPVLGGTADRVWAAAGVHQGLLEQQVSLGWGIMALGLVAASRWIVRDRQPAALPIVPVLVSVGLVALCCSLSPERTIGAFTVVRPSAFLYDVVPMFRSYARFGVVVLLMAVLLAGVGVDALRRAGTRRAKVLCIALLVLAVGEYAVLPSALWRDILPTTAHRWAMQQNDRTRVLDCTPPTQESESVGWLTAGRVTVLGGQIADCGEANLSGKLVAHGYTHLLVRRDAAGERLLAALTPQDGLRAAASFNDGQVFAVTAILPDIYVAAWSEFFPREHDSERSWRWMGGAASWTIVNAGTRPIVATLGLELSAFSRTRRMEVRLDGHRVQTLVVETAQAVHRVGPFTVAAGEHTLVFHPLDPPTVASDVIDNGDQRPLSFAVGTWRWIVEGLEP